jgi:LacI family transcriptional regulator
MSLSKETQFKADFHHTVVIDQGMPVVMFDRSLMKFCDKAIIDDKQAAQEAVQSLIDKEENLRSSPPLIMSA